MIRITDTSIPTGLWVGNSDDAEGLKVWDGGLLNTAPDLAPPRKIALGAEYAQVGLVDGPGNEPTDYCAALMVLAGLMRRHDSTLIYDHDGARAIVVGIMYLAITHGRGNRPASASHRRPTWTEALALITVRMEVPNLNPAHTEAYDSIPFGLLEVLL